jgi:hypothetical protein
MTEQFLSEAVLRQNVAAILAALHIPRKKRMMAKMTKFGDRPSAIPHTLPITVAPMTTVLRPKLQMECASFSSAVQEN